MTFLDAMSDFMFCKIVLMRNTWVFSWKNSDISDRILYAELISKVKKHSQCWPISNSSFSLWNSHVNACFLGKFTTRRSAVKLWLSCFSSLYSTMCESCIFTYLNCTLLIFYLIIMSFAERAVLKSLTIIRD